MKKLLAVFLVGSFATIAVIAKDRYKADWKDLDRYPQAEWISEAKLGLYWHWNYNSVAGYDGWYGRNMYKEGSWAYQNHVKNHGDPAQFGYKDFAPLFTAEKFDAEQWVADAQRIGARFIVGMAVHHDGFDLYDSSYTPWNSVDKPPHIDVIGELAKAARAKGMKFGATSHLAWNWHFFSANMYPDKFDAEEAPELYNIHEPNGGPSDAFVEEWYNRTTELIDKYELDFLWFDFGTQHPKFKDHYTAKLTAHFYNRGDEWGKTVALATKVGFENRESLMHDCEQAKFGYIRYPQWMSDSTMNSGWFNLGGNEDYAGVTGGYWIHQLIDIVSKNGTLLLNLGPKADGSWPEAWKQELFKLGAWLDVNGEAIYGTKPWHRYGEGPNHAGCGVHYDLGGMLSANDVRFTRKGDVLYAIVGGWQPNPYEIMSLGTDEIPGLKISTITALGLNKPITWKQNERALRIQLAKHEKLLPAYVFKIEGEGLFPERAPEYLPVKMYAPQEQKIAALRVRLPGANETLSIAEVVAIDTSKGPFHNAAPKGAITMSSCITDAYLALDQNQNGHPNMKSVAVTKAEQDPWLLLTLDEPRKLGEVEIFAGMENFESFSENAVLECLDEDGKVISTRKIKDHVDQRVKGGNYKGMSG